MNTGAGASRLRRGVTEERTTEENGKKRLWKEHPKVWLELGDLAPGHVQRLPGHVRGSV